MSITIDDELAKNALLAASVAGSKDLVVGLIKAGVKAGSIYGAALAGPIHRRSGISGVLSA